MSVKWTVKTTRLLALWPSTLTSARWLPVFPGCSKSAEPSGTPSNSLLRKEPSLCLTGTCPGWAHTWVRSDGRQSEQGRKRILSYLQNSSVFPTEESEGRTKHWQGEKCWAKVSHQPPKKGITEGRKWRIETKQIRTDSNWWKQAAYSQQTSQFCIRKLKAFG